MSALKTITRGVPRRLASAAAALAIAALAGFTSAPAASAANGDNGDVKIHAVGASFLDERNEPHVCQFYVDAFDFDAGQKITWVIDQQSPTGHAQVLSG